MARSHAPLVSMILLRHRYYHYYYYYYYLYVLVFNQISMILLRHRYYFAWVLTDAGCNAAGFGYDGEDTAGGQKWGRVLNLDYMAVEMPPNFRSAMTGWNIATSNWLRRCVYERVPAQYKQTATFGMSALWHGFYPGYYLTFCSSAIFNE
ncbi:MBOAT, membrane-bound O-acyltransferase family-domain-containing protein, partial [Baffinella frigidus]